MTYYSETFNYFEVVTKILELITITLFPVVRDQFEWDIKATYNGLPYKVLNFFKGDSG